VFCVSIYLQLFVWWLTYTSYMGNTALAWDYPDIHLDGGRKQCQLH